MGELVTNASFSSQPVRQAPAFDLTTTQAERVLRVHHGTINRWRKAGRIWPYDPYERPDGHYVELPSGRPRFSLEQIEGIGLTRRYG